MAITRWKTSTTSSRDPITRCWSTKCGDDRSYERNDAPRDSSNETSSETSGAGSGISGAAIDVDDPPPRLALATAQSQETGNAEPDTVYTAPTGGERCPSTPRKPGRVRPERTSRVSGYLPRLAGLDREPPRPGGTAHAAGRAESGAGRSSGCAAQTDAQSEWPCRAGCAALDSAPGDASRRRSGRVRHRSARGRRRNASGQVRHGSARRRRGNAPGQVRDGAARRRRGDAPGQVRDGAAKRRLR